MGWRAESEWTALRGRDMLTLRPFCKRAIDVVEMAVREIPTGLRCGDIAQHYMGAVHRLWAYKED